MMEGLTHRQHLLQANNDMNIKERILELKKERNAVILAHNYQIGEVQDIADHVGDSLGLSRIAAKVDADVILFAGVYFMGETAKILAPNKTVIIPDKNAGCPLANMIVGRELRTLKEKHPNAVVVCYVNSSADIKAESDYCCTSANAVNVVNSIPKDKEIIFVPDKNLGRYVEIQSGRKLIRWQGYCPTHQRILPEHILKRRDEYPDAPVVAHPECSEEVLEHADHICSTTGMIEFSKNSNSDNIIVCTEIGMIHRLKKDVPDKNFVPVTELADCPNMKLNNPEKILWALEDMEYQVEVPVDVAQKAQTAIQRMVEIG